MSVQDTTKGISPADLTAILGLVLTPGSSVIRWGIPNEPAWVHAVEVAAPLAGAVLVTRAVSAGKSGYFFGFLISTQEANDFLINWTSGGVAKSKRIVLGGKGTISEIEPIAMNSGFPADAGTAVTITNVTAGNALIVYQANLLYGEV